MGRHLKLDRWYDKTSTGTLRMKRVSAANETKFPRKWRVILSKEGASKTVKALMDSMPSTSLAEAWAKLKSMVND